MDRMVTVSGQDGAFPVAPGTSVLEAALRANRWLPHACSQGTCGTCKIRVLSGEVDHGAAEETILSADERSSGLALACQSKPHGDLTIAPVNDADPGRPMHPLRDYIGRSGNCPTSLGRPAGSSSNSTSRWSSTPVSTPN